MEDILFKKLRYDDINNFIELRKQQLLEEGADAEIDITNMLVDYYKRHLKDGTFVSWIATVNDEIVATSGMSFVEQPPHYGNLTGRIGIVSSMYTIGEYRRKGISRKLLYLIVNEAKEYGCGVVQITSSATGVYLYEDFGFKRFNKFYRYNLK